MKEARKKLRICPLCEATCGLELDVDGREVRALRGDGADPFSAGYVCPKGIALKDLDTDADRLRAPMIRRNGAWHAVSWGEAFEEIDRNLRDVMARHGKNSVGLYMGNPTVHNTALALYAPALRVALGTHNVFSASSVDQLPKQLAVGLLFGNALSVPIPDIDRCQCLVILGANPLVSNGSLMTAPNFGERLKRLRERGGKVIVVDPCRTKTAKAADEYHAIRPGSDAYLLFAMVHTLFAENLVSPGRLGEHTVGMEEVRALAEPFTPEEVSERCGIAAEVIRTLTRTLAAANGAAVYGRIGTCTQQFGTLASWLVEVIHVLTGNLDHEGGAMFTKPAHGPANTKGAPGVGHGLRVGRWKSRVRGCPEILGELPVACLAEELETPGENQIRAMITVAGNPCLSAPNSARLARAFEGLEFMVSLDLYLNETTRHANVILPGLSPLENGHYDFVFSQFAIHNHARYSPPVFEPPEGHVSEWESLLKLVGIVSGMGPRTDTGLTDDGVMLRMVQREVKGASSVIHGRDPQEILAALEPRRGPARVTDFMLRTGPYGEGFGTRPDGLSLAALERNPRGIDLGPMCPRVPEVLRTPSGKIELAPTLIVNDVARLREGLYEAKPQMALIGRRDLRSNNSWMHNVDHLVSGKPRCTLQIHPKDAERLGLRDSSPARVSSRVGSIVIPVEISEDISPGVVSIPHGWGHDEPGTGQRIAGLHAGVNSNRLADDVPLDAPSGNSVLCGIPVTISKA
jgi:anaerobic selenocysteine-containing dehydrogenase